MKKMSKPHKDQSTEDGRCPCTVNEFPCAKCSKIILDPEEGPNIPQFIPPVKTNDLFVPAYSDKWGFYLRAKQNIKSGTVIWKELPLVTAPLEPEEITELGAGTCTSCYKIVPQSVLKKCSQCDWRVCSLECEKMAEHKMFECANKAPFDKTAGLPALSTFAYRITLLKKMGPTKFQHIMSMPDTSSPSMETDRMVELMKNLEFQALQDWFKLEGVVTYQEYETISRIIKLNALGLNMRYMDQDEKRLGIGLYTNAALMRHSCRPNCGLLIKAPPSNELTVYATIDIKEGSLLTRFYRERLQGKTFMGGTVERQRLLGMEDVTSFLCQCELCTDPLEKGTHMSTLICQKCKKASLLPVNPGAQLLLNKSEEWEWRCKTTGCKNTFKNSELDALHEEMLEITAFVPINVDESMKCSGRWGKLKDGFKDKCHPNYWPIVSGANELYRQYWHVYKAQMYTTDWKDRDDIMAYLLKIYDIIRPGISPERARLLDHMSTSLYQWIFVKFMSEEYHPSEVPVFEEQLASILEKKTEALQYFDLDPESALTKEVKRGIKEANRLQMMVRMQLMNI